MTRKVDWRKRALAAEENFKSEHFVRENLYKAVAKRDIALADLNAKLRTVTQERDQLRGDIEIAMIKLGAMEKHLNISNPPKRFDLLNAISSVEFAVEWARKHIEARGQENDALRAQIEADDDLLARQRERLIRLTEIKNAAEATSNVFRALGADPRLMQGENCVRWVRMLELHAMFMIMQDLRKLLAALEVDSHLPPAERTERK